MKMEKLRNEFLKSGRVRMGKNTKQRNICVSLLRKAKKKQYRSYNEKTFTNDNVKALTLNNFFSKTVKIRRL